MKIKEVYPHITDQIVIFYARNENDEIVNWNPVKADWELFKKELLDSNNTV